jgi:regulator of replication initiation timing
MVLALIPAVMLGLALSWVWKSNQVKDYYKQMKKLETERANLISENMRLRAELTDLKSLSHINAIVTREFGLTQNVSERIFLADPVAPEKKQSKIEFAAEMDMPDWLETAVIGSGRIRAEQPKDTGEKTE